MKIITTILLMLAMPSFAQKILKPELSSENNFTVAQQLKWETLIAKGEDQDLEKDPENFDSYNGPYTFEPGCSWYCGGEMYKVTSDAYLPANGKADYKPDNLHDFNLLTAWVPKGSIGKKINFHFKPLSPRVNKIIIYNGYIKNYDLFK
jgi:hypothetical protein